MPSLHPVFNSISVNIGCLNLSMFIDDDVCPIFDDSIFILCLLMYFVGKMVLLYQLIMIARNEINWYISQLSMLPFWS